MGSLDGVVFTRAAWLGKREVVEVRFRPSVLPFEALLAAAIARSCDQRVFATTEVQLATARAKVGERAERFDVALHGPLRVAAATEQLYYLGRSSLRFVPLTPMQARRVNAALSAQALAPQVAGTDAAPDAFLSPRQRELARRIAAALVARPEAMSGLHPPTADVGLTGLADYQRRLERVLQTSE
ncbi:MAG: hypothetical protein R3F49_24800 [Planctomycetota bacterium]